MKDLIGIAILIATLFGSTKVLREVHFHVKKAALQKAAQGLPRIGNFN